MQIGFGVPVSGTWATPQNQARIAQRAEELGYASLWTFQRLLYPEKPQGERWAPAYRSVLDPLVTLGFLAGQTSHIRLGVAILNAPFYSPILLAKQLAAIDVLSEGRLDAGLGLGWSPEEFAAAGADPAGRGRRMEDFIRCLDAILTQDPVEYHGEFYDVPRSHVDPRPVQRPRPPILIGASSEPALKRAGRLADGWVSASRADLTGLGTAAETVRAGAREAGRDPSTLRFVCRGSVKVRDRRDGPLTGSYDEIRADFATIAEQGITELFVDFNFDPEIGSLEVDAQESMRRAEEALEAFAP